MHGSLVMGVRRLRGLVLVIALVLITRPAGAFDTGFDVGAGPRLTTSTTLPLGSCRRTDCAAAPRNAVELRARGAGQSLSWSWGGGAALPVEQLGDPRMPGGTHYALCVADGANALILRVELPTCAGGTGCWKTIGDRGLRFKGGAGVRTLTIMLSLSLIHI